MSDSRNDPQHPDLQSTATVLIVRLAVVALLAVWCFAIFRPFLVPLVWGLVLAVALRPAYAGIERAIGGRRKLAAILLVVLCLGILVVPTVVLSKSLFDGVRLVSSYIEESGLSIPPAPDRVAEWPLVGPKIQETWDFASTNFEAALRQFSPQVKAFGAWLVALAKQSTLAVLLTGVALVIAALLLVRRAAAAKVALDIGARIAGDEGAEAVRLAGQTIGSVANGVVGVAAIQAALAAAGFAVAGIPGAACGRCWSWSWRLRNCRRSWCSGRRSSISSPRTPAW